MTDAEKRAAARGSECYTATVGSIEPNITSIDPGAFYASAAISLKRIADVLEKQNQAIPLRVVVCDKTGNSFVADYFATNGGGVHVYQLPVFFK